MKSCLALTLALLAPAAWAADPVSFSEQIRPLLEKRCLGCHGAEQQMSGLDLSARESALRGGAHGPAIQPDNPAESLLLAYVRGSKEPRMPLGDALAADDVELLARWVEQGAPYDATLSSKAAPADDPASWWAFQPPVQAPPPTVADARWRRNPIDAFVRARLDAAGVEPAPPADRRTLIRRAWLDLVGMLPPPDEVERFVADSSPDAWTRLVDDLLAKPQYGERWGRHWLDVARYADSSGYEHDFDYPDAWRFRDYVIASFNQDKPYDRFVQEQLAGDELSDWSFETLIATGFQRIGPRVLFREKDNPEYRYNYLDDMIQTSSRAFMGLSVECARCHDHKFDPIQQLDYYRMMAIFFPHIRYDFPLASEAQIREYETRKTAVEQSIAPLNARIREIEAPYREMQRREQLKGFPQEIQDAVNTPEAERTEGQKLLAEQVLSIGVGNYGRLLSDEDRQQVQSLKVRIAELEKELPEPLPTAMGVRDGDYRSAPDGRGDEVQPGKGEREVYENVGPFVPEPGRPYNPPVAHLLPHSDYHDKGPVVEPGVVTILARLGEFDPQPPDNGRVSTGRRLALAKWLTSGEHPLTSRVMANRIWQHHFGRGLVLTASNFGKMGRKPTHPELLDWLAVEFVKQGWSVKALHRLILDSETYRMASVWNPPGASAADPENNLLWRYPSRRLEGEIVRDITLEAAGSLNLEAGGEPFFPPIPEAVRESFLKGRWEMTQPGPAVWRRSVYSYQKRGLRYPMFEVFDQPSMNVTCERRTTTTVPTQALTLLNNQLILEQAALFARRVRDEAGADPAAQVDRAWRIALSRPPSDEELEGNRAFLARQRDYHARTDDPSLAALTDLCDVVLNLNEFVYVP
ncbi:MAG: DUF1553 domain-containing protein [Acidobacteria bacterium]|nr:DUF1553 domain-containing protein [Acidobacteriota bacterium]